MESPTTTGNTPEERQKIAAEYREAKGDKAQVAALVAKHGVSSKQMNDWARRRGDPRGFSDELKREAVAYAKAHTERAAAAKFKVSQRSIQVWKKKPWATDGKKVPRNLGLKKKKGRGSNLGPPHPKEVKAEALRALAKGERPRDVANRLKLPHGTVSSWHWKHRHDNPSGRRRRKADPVALGNEALGIKPNGVTRRRGGRPDTKAVIKAIRDLRGQGTTIESVAVEGSTCTITFRVTETFEV